MRGGKKRRKNKKEKKRKGEKEIIPDQKNRKKAKRENSQSKEWGKAKRTRTNQRTDFSLTVKGRSMIIYFIAK